MHFVPVKNNIIGHNYVENELKYILKSNDRLMFKFKYSEINIVVNVIDCSILENVYYNMYSIQCTVV